MDKARGTGENYSPPGTGQTSMTLPLLNWLWPAGIRHHAWARASCAEAQPAVPDEHLDPAFA
jgi:hypothetical protein